MTDTEQGGDKGPASGVVFPAKEYGAIADVLAWVLRAGGLSRPDRDPLRIRTDRGQRLVEVHVGSPEDVVRWGRDLGLDAPVNRRNEELRQIIVEAAGYRRNWRVEIRYVLTVQYGQDMPAAVLGGGS